MRRCALFTLWILTIAVPSLHAAPQLPALLPVECDRLIELLLATTAPDDRRRVADALVDMTSHTQCLADAMMQRAAFPSFLRLLETRRTDKQSGASAGTGGSTNLVSKGTTAKILSVAAEYGALTETVNKQLVTVQGSADGIPATLIRHNLVRYCPTRGSPRLCQQHVDPDVAAIFVRRVVRYRRIGADRLQHTYHLGRWNGAAGGLLG